MKKGEAIVAIQSGKKVGHPHIQNGYFTVTDGLVTYYDGSRVWPTTKSANEMLSNYSDNDDRFVVMA